MHVLSSIRAVSSPLSGRCFEPLPAVVIASIALAVVILVPDDLRQRWSGPRAAASVAPHPAIDVTPPAVHLVSTLPTAAAAASTTESDVDQDEVDVLSDSLSRRYRVSEEVLRDVIEAAYGEARRNRIDPMLVLALIAIESRFNPIAQSPMGALGLMQVIPRYHPEKLAESDEITDPQVNIRVGTQVLKEYIRRGGSENAGLQLYNGSSDDATHGYAIRVNAERQRLTNAVKRVRTQIRGNRMS